MIFAQENQRGLLIFGVSGLRARVDRLIGMMWSQWERFEYLSPTKEFFVKAVILSRSGRRRNQAPVAGVLWSSQMAIE